MGENKKVNKEKYLKIIVVISVIVDLIIFGSLLYRNNRLKQEIANLKYDYKELQDSIFSQKQNIATITSNLNEITEFINNEKRTEKNWRWSIL